MNIERACNVKKDYNEITLGERLPYIADPKDKIAVQKYNDIYCVQCEQSIEFLQKNGFYGKLMESQFNENPGLPRNYLLLSDIEVIFLLIVFDSICIKSFDNKTTIPVDEIWLGCIEKYGGRFLSLYVCYHYYRSFGWVVRPALRFGSDFLLYIASPDHCHASYSVCVKTYNPNTCRDRLTEEELFNQVRVSHSVSKSTIICKVSVDSSRPLADLRVIYDCNVEEFHITRFDPHYEINSKPGSKV